MKKLSFLEIDGLKKKLEKQVDDEIAFEIKKRKIEHLRKKLEDDNYMKKSIEKVVEVLLQC